LEKIDRRWSVRRACALLGAFNLPDCDNSAFTPNESAQKAAFHEFSYKP
jgi:hypothetical protein